MSEPSPDTVSGKIHGLPVEVSVVFAIQMAVVTGLVQLDRVVSLGGALNALVGGVFIFLPVLVLDRRGKPYRRYGLAIGAPRRLLAQSACLKARGRFSLEPARVSVQKSRSCPETHGAKQIRHPRGSICLRTRLARLPRCSR